MTGKAALELALKHHQSGRLQEAESLYRKVIEAQPKNADALHLLGVIAQQQARYEEAVTLIGQAISASPRAAVYYCNLGIALDGLERVDEALAAYERAVALKPEYPKALTNMGVTLRALGRLDEAIAAHECAIEFKPDFAEAHHNLGVALVQAGRPDDAITAYRDAIRLEPDYAEAHNGLGMILCGKGLFEEAIACYRRAIEHKPGYAEAHNHLGVALSYAGLLDEAVASYERAIALKADFMGARLNLAAERAAQGHLEPAMAACRHFIALDNGNAEAHVGLAHALLMRGEFREGWEEYEWRWKWKDFTSFKRDFVQPLWDGSPLEGRTILLHAEQGLGDAIQFVRYVSLVLKQGGNIILECQPEIWRLFQTISDAVTVVKRGEPLPFFDFHCPLLSLPRIFGTELATIPADVPYLHAEASQARAWRDRIESELGLAARTLTVGLAWAGSPKHAHDRRRSLKLARLAPLTGIPSVRYFSLQKGGSDSEAGAPPAGMNIIDWTVNLKEFADTAALVSSLDLVIAVDTSVAHLTGALGKPVWTLHAAAPDWRWQRDRSDSPWYPTMRLFRQRKAGDWESVVADVRREIQALAESKTSHAHFAGA